MAAKVVWKPSLKNGKQRQKLLSEIQIHQALSHPNIVTIECVFEDDENVYLIMELCTNKTFVDLLKKRRRLTDDECRFWMWQLLDGIRYMHRKGYIHRDIKLGNMFLDSKMNLQIGILTIDSRYDDTYLTSR
jgi:cell cycle serine/threonine-protein kinase CDC5/MSD2